MANTQATRTATKPATKPAVKGATKPAAKQASKGEAKQAPMLYAALLSEAIAGGFGPTIARFYKNAMAYHAKQKTQFPRQAIATVPLMSVEDGRAFIEKHARTSIPAGSHTAQRMFDAMMIETQTAK